MKYAFLVLALAFMTGCGAFTNKDVASDVIVDDGRTLEQTDDITGDEFALDNIINPKDDQSIIVGDTEVIIVEDETAVLPTDTSVSAQLGSPAPGTVTPATGRTSPVTGPSIPEEEMRVILNAQLEANGEAPRY